MPDIKWIKLTTEMFDDEKIRIIESMPEADTLIVLWIRLICMAGKTNDGGNIYLTPEMPYTIDQLAAVFNRPLNTVKLAIETFTRLKMVTLHENGTLFLPAFEKHQNINGMEKIKEQTRIRVAAFREKQRLLALPEPNTPNKDVTLRNDPVTQQNRIDKSRLDINKDIDVKIPPTDLGEKVKAVFFNIDKLRGYRPPKRNAEAAAIIRMLKKNYSPDQITKAWSDLKQEDFWKGKELFLMSVESQIGAILSGDKPQPKRIITPYTKVN